MIMIIDGIGVNAFDTEIGTGVIVQFFGELLDALVGVEGKVGELISEFGVFLLELRDLLDVLILFFLQFEDAFFELVDLVLELRGRGGFGGGGWSGR